MTTTLTSESETCSLVEEVRQLKEQNAAAFNFDIRAIGDAARENQAQHPDRIVSREVARQKSAS